MAHHVATVRWPGALTQIPNTSPTTANLQPEPRPSCLALRLTAVTEATDVLLKPPINSQWEPPASLRLVGSIVVHVVALCPLAGRVEPEHRHTDRMHDKT